MAPLRHRRDKTLQAHALVVVVGLVLAKVVQVRVKKAGVEAKSLGSVLKPLKDVQRARLQYGKDAPVAQACAVGANRAASAVAEGPRFA
jgi:transposase